MLSDDLYLLKFRASDNTGQQDYFTVIDKFGQIKHLPKKTEKHLVWSNFSTGQSRLKKSGTTLILRGGQKRILSLDADSTYEEHAITAMEFNRNGEVMSIKVFDKDMYDDVLRSKINK